MTESPIPKVLICKLVKDVVRQVWANKKLTYASEENMFYRSPSACLGE